MVSSRYKHLSVLTLLLVLLLPCSEQATLLTCSFESSSICGFTQSTSDDFNWSRDYGGTPSSSTGPSAAYSGSYYMYIETSSPRIQGDTAVLYTPSLNLAGGCGRLVFRYNAYGGTLGYLRVKLYNGQYMTQQLWEYTGYSSSSWQETSVYFEQGGNFQIAFEGVRGTSYTGDFAIDVVTVSTENSSYCDSLNRGLLYCDFERADTTCGFTTGLGSVFSWTRNSGSTPSSNTGPSFDYTTGLAGVGYYYYTEVTSRNTGDTAILESSNFVFHETCVEVAFAYHAYGGDLGTLSVILVHVSTSTQNVLWHSSSVTSNNNWIMESVRLNDTVAIVANVNYKLQFKVIRGSGYRGDFAIDNVKVSSGCSVNNATDPLLINATEVWGRLTSPNFPAYYSNNVVYQRDIYPAPYTNVIFYFATLSVEGGSYDYVLVNNIKYVTRPSSSFVVSGVGSYVRVYFRSDSSQTRQGFDLYYKATSATGSSYGKIDVNDYSSTGSGTLTSPLYPNNHYGTYDYWWIITARTSYLITITFTSIDMRDTQGCVQDFVKVFDGRPEKGLHTASGVGATYALMGRFCGYTTPSMLTTTQNSSMIVFQTNENSACCYSGFSLSYAVVAASAVTLAPGSTSVSNVGWGRLTSPNYPLTYPHNRDTTWVLNAYPSSYIRFKFADLNLETSYDYVKVDGVRYDQPSDAPYAFIVYKQVVTVIFHSDGSISRVGFDLYWKGTDVTTSYGGINYQSWTGSSSPSSVNGIIYGRNTWESYGNFDRWWIFNAPQDYVVQMTVSALDITSSTSCASGSLKIYDGLPTTTGSYALIASLCGISAPSTPYVSSTNGSMVLFKYNTLSSSSNRYFSLSYYLVSRWNSVGVTAGSGGSGGTGTTTFTTFGRITSPYFPGNYPHNTNKYWVVNGAPFLYLRFRLTQLHVESGHDYVEVDNIRHSTYSSYSWTVYKQIASVYFHSDSSVSDIGFELFWKGTNVFSTTKGGVSHSTNLVADTSYNLQSQDYGSSHIGTYDWWWIIEADEDSTIKFEFEAMDLPMRNSCALDYVKIYDGIPTGDGSYSLLQTSCGSSTPSSVTTTQNTSMIMFYIDENTVSGFTGFKLKYTAKAGAGGSGGVDNGWIYGVVAVVVLLAIAGVVGGVIHYSQLKKKRARSREGLTNDSNTDRPHDNGVTNPSYTSPQATMPQSIPQTMQPPLQPISNGYMYTPGPEYPPPSSYGHMPAPGSGYPPPSSYGPPPFANNVMPPVNYPPPPAYSEAMSPQLPTDQYPPPPLPSTGATSTTPFTVQPTETPMFHNVPPTFAGHLQSKPPLA
ncbi:cubilin-like [Lingula anatina]|uniref:Cubilin-like n=1 Tax=Lingula anatina TaxID=7574 RepID=A0A1S3HC92_LINAN|nr:cubilin-like [Lingula anatina]|eukprot:XP_013382774.1 cubilin-like [Lingula anatina]